MCQSWFTEARKAALCLGKSTTTSCFSPAHFEHLNMCESACVASLQSRRGASHNGARWLSWRKSPCSPAEVMSSSTNQHGEWYNALLLQCRGYTWGSLENKSVWKLRSSGSFTHFIHTVNIYTLSFMICVNLGGQGFYKKNLSNTNCCALGLKCFHWIL